MASLLQQTVQATQGVAASDKSTETQIQGNESPSTFYEGHIEAAPATGDANDSGFFEDEDSVAPGTNYKDFTLFPDGRSEVDVDKYQLFADLDASTRGYAGSFDSDSSNDSGVEFDDSTPGSQLSTHAEDAVFSDAVDDAILETVNQAVFDVINKDYDIHSNPEYVPPAPTADAVIDPFRSWLGAYHHHEHLQYLLDQSPYPIRESELQ